MNFSMIRIANRILDEIATLLIKVEDIDPKCIAQLNLDTDIMNCLKLSSLQFLLFKFYLEKTYHLPFDHLELDRDYLAMKELITYIIVHTDDDILHKWNEEKWVA